MTRKKSRFTFVIIHPYTWTSSDPIDWFRHICNIPKFAAGSILIKAKVGVVFWVSTLDLVQLPMLILDSWAVANSFGSKVNLVTRCVVPSIKGLAEPATIVYALTFAAFGFDLKWHFYLLTMIIILSVASDIYYLYSSMFFSESGIETTNKVNKSPVTIAIRIRQQIYAASCR